MAGYARGTPVLTVGLTDPQNDWLVRQAKRLGVSKSLLLRFALDQAIVTLTKWEQLPRPLPLGELVDQARENAETLLSIANTIVEETPK